MALSWLKLVRIGWLQSRNLIFMVGKDFLVMLLGKKNAELGSKLANKPAKHELATQVRLAGHSLEIYLELYGIQFRGQRSLM